MTTGGGALRDLRQRAEAVHIEMGDIVIGAEWYEKAEVRGAKREMIDRELGSILRAAPQDQRVQFKTALKGLSPSGVSVDVA